MIVNRVFCYSKEIAKKNGNKLPILALVLSTILGITAFISVVIMNKFNGIIFAIIFIAWLSLIIYYSIILMLRLVSRMTAYATDTEGRIFKTIAMNDGQGLYFGGVAAGGMIDQFAGNDSNPGESLGGAVGAAGGRVCGVGRGDDEAQSACIAYDKGGPECRARRAGRYTGAGGRCHHVVLYDG